MLHETRCCQTSHPLFSPPSAYHADLLQGFLQQKIHAPLREIELDKIQSCQARQCSLFTVYTDINLSFLCIRAPSAQDASSSAEATCPFDSWSVSSPGMPGTGLGWDEQDFLTPRLGVGWDGRGEGIGGRKGRLGLRDGRSFKKRSNVSIATEMYGALLSQTDEFLCDSV